MHVNKINVWLPPVPKSGCPRSESAAKLSPSRQRGMPRWAWSRWSAQGRNTSLLGHSNILSFVVVAFVSNAQASAWDRTEILAASTSLFTWKEAARKYHGSWPSQPAPDASPTLPGVTRDTDRWLSAWLVVVSWPPSAVPMSRQTAVTGSVRQPLLRSHGCVLVTRCSYATTELPKSECPNSALGWAPSHDFYNVP